MRVLIGFVLGLIVAGAVAFGYFLLGMAPVATQAAPMPFERYLANKALHAEIQRQMPKDVPIQPTEDNLVAGAKLYRENCAVCHGLPGQEVSAIGRGEFPKPPSLFKGKGVTDDPPGETFWKVKNGIRLTGMPGFGASYTDTQLWQVSLMLAGADKLPERARAELK